MKSTALLTLIILLSALSLAAQGKPSVWIGVHFEGCTPEDTTFFPDCGDVRKDTERKATLNLVEYLNNRTSQLGAAIYFHFFSDDLPDKKPTTLEFRLRREGKLSIKILMQVTCTLGGYPIDETKELTSFTLPLGITKETWFEIIREALDQSSLKSQDTLEFLQNAIVYGVNALQDQSQFVLPLNSQELEMLTRAKFLISQDENHWYCARGTGAPNTGAFDYPAIAVQRDPLQSNTQWLKKTVSCGRTVGKINRFFLNQLGQH